MTSLAERMRSILLLPSKESSLKEMLYFSRALEATGRYRCSFAVKRDYQPRWMQAIRDQGHAIHYVRPEPGGEQAAEESLAGDARRRSKASLKQLRRKVMAGPKQAASAVSRALLIGSVLKYRRHLAHFRQDILDAQSLCDAAQPDLLVVATDRTLGLQTALLAECRRRGASSMVIPWATWSPNEEYYSRTARPHWRVNYGLGRAANRFAARRFPELVIRGNEHELLFRPGEMIFAADRLEILPPHPLRAGAGSGFSDFVAVESQRIYRQYLDRGVPSEIMSVTGRVSSDELYATIQAAKNRAGELRASLGAAPGQPIILCAVPNSAEQNLCSWSEHWRLTEMLVGAMAFFRQARVVLNVHPKSDPERYRTIAAKHGALVADRPIEQLMPLCDLFVSTNSSTIVMAVGCEKPVLDLEIYGVVDECFESCPGVTIVRDEALVFPTLKRLMEDEEHVQTLVRGQRERKDEWIRLDGRCAARTIEAVDRLIETQPGGGKEADRMKVGSTLLEVRRLVRTHVTHTPESRRLHRQFSGSLDETQIDLVARLHETGLAAIGFNDLFGAGGAPLWRALCDEAEHFARSDKVEGARRGTLSNHEEKAFKSYIVRRHEDGEQIAADNPLLRFALSDRVLGVVNGYLGLCAKLNYCNLWYTLPQPADRAPVASQRWHRDPEDSQLIKVFLYFTDVAADNGPLEYIPDSRQGGKHAHLWRFAGGAGVGGYPPGERIEAAVPASDRLSAVGPRGTIFFCDTSGLHRGGKLASGERILANLAYLTPASLYPRKFACDPEAAEASTAASYALM